jgi:hypothetical protein
VKPARRNALAATAALVVLALTGCGAQAGAASVVGGTSIRDSDVVTAVDGVRGAVGAQNLAAFDEAAVTRATVNRLTRHYLLDEAAARQGIVVTQAQVDDLISSTITSGFAGDPAKFQQALAAKSFVPPNEISAFAHDVLVTQELTKKLAPGGDATAQTNKLDAYLGPLGKEMGIEISPRFGTWSFAASTIGDLPHDLTLAPATAPSAATTP